MGWAVLILIGTSIPGSNLPRLPFSYFDLVMHGGLYGVLGFLLHRAVSEDTRLGSSGSAWLVAFATAQTYGLADEVHQLWIAGRSCSATDVLADGLGAAAGVVVYYLWRKYRQCGSELVKTSARSERNGGQSR